MYPPGPSVNGDSRHKSTIVPLYNDSIQDAFIKHDNKHEIE